MDRLGAGDLFVHQTAYLQDVLKRFGISITDTNPTALPLPTNYGYTGYNGIATPDNTLTRPDI